MKLTTLVASFAVALSFASPARAGTELAEALAAFRAGEYPRTLELAHSVARGTPEHPKALYLAGETNLLLGDLAAAERDFRGVLAERPKAVPALIGLGRALSLRGAHADARAALDQALALEPKDVAARRALGELQTLMGDLADARTTLLAVFEESPKDPSNARALVTLLLRMDVAPDALQVAVDFAEARPEQPMGPFLLGLVHEKLGEDEKAIGDYQKAIELDGKFLDAHKNLAIVCHTLSNTYRIPERNRLAMRHYAMYFELGGKDPALAETYGVMQQFFTAEGTFKDQPAQGG